MIDKIDDLNFQRYVVNRVVPMPVILSYAGLTDYDYNSTCFCPFHDNKNTPSAKLYKDEDGDSLWCFAEQRRYRSSDVIKYGILNKLSISDVFYRIWRQLSDDVKNNLISQYDRPVTYIPDEWNENKYKLDGFRNGSMSMREYLNVLVSIVK